MYSVVILASSSWLFGVAMAFLNGPRLLDWANSPPHLQFNRYVLTGYRPISSVQECVKSLFYLHNELGNIYTHGECDTDCKNIACCHIWRCHQTCPKLTSYFFWVETHFICFTLCLLLAYISWFISVWYLQCLQHLYYNVIDSLLQYN